MDRSLKRIGIWAVAAMAVGLSGCHTVATPPVTLIGEVVPRTGEFVVVNDVEIIVDASASMECEAKFPFEANLVQSFVAGMPTGSYNAGMTAFGQTPQGVWTRQPLAPYDRNTFNSAASSLALLRGRTPLPAVLRSLESEMTGRTGRTAIVVFSDGMATQSGTLDACKQLAAVHAGELCIYTVQIGNDPEGSLLLSRMVETTGCGLKVTGGAISKGEGMQAFIRTVFMNGDFVPEPACIDSDEDGVCNDVDDCPGTPRGVAVNERGCWGLPPVYFDTDQSVIKPEFQNIISTAAELLKRNPGIKLQIDGHTDARDTDPYNMGLGQRRADSVRNAIAAHGLDHTRFRTTVFGERHPAANNATATGRAENRRVEFMILPE